MSAVLSSVSGH